MYGIGVGGALARILILATHIEPLYLLDKPYHTMVEP